MMKKIILNLGILIMSSLLAISGNIDVSKFAVGRVRFVEGDSAKFTFNNKTAKVDIDYLVLLGATFETNKSKLEVVDLNSNLYWFDKDSKFNFESYDPKGEKTSLFLGKGSFAIETAMPSTLLTASGSIYFPANGVYFVEKLQFGKTKTKISVLKGKRPSLIKNVGLFSKMEISNKVDKGNIYYWMEKKQKDWEKTLVRCRLFSNCDIMSPYVADTKSDGNVIWKKIGYVKPLSRADLMIDGNSFYYLGEDVLRAAAIAPNLVNKFDEQQLRLWFATNQFNAIKWTWNVAKGWHAEFYYDPLINFGADCSYSTSGYFNYRVNSFYDVFLRMPNYFELKPYTRKIYPIDFNSKNVKKYTVKTVKQKAITTGVKPIKVPVSIIAQDLVKTRMVTDTSLKNVKNISKLTVKERDIERAKSRIVKTRSGNRPGFSRGAHIRPSAGRSYYSSRVVGRVSGNKKK